MSLDKRRKAALDRNCLEFNQWATRVLTQVHKKAPRASVTLKQLMIFWIADMHFRTVAQHIVRRHHTNAGGS